jgi:hypothetical protein
MPSTIDNLITTLRDSDIIPPRQIIYGITDKLQPPYISVLDYSHQYDYQTGGPPSSIKRSTFRVVVTDKSQTGAEAVAEQVDALLNCTDAATPQTVGCVQESYAVGQMIGSDVALYQFGVDMTYTLTEDPSKT